MKLRLSIANVVYRILFAVVMLAAADKSRAADEPAYPPQASLEEIQRRIHDYKPQHPRLFATREELLNLPKAVEGDPLRKQLAASIIAQANSLRDAKPIERELQGVRLLEMSRRCSDRVLTLATAYYLTSDVRHVERCKQEMLAAARFSDWNPVHYLDVAEMTCALAIGYDWLYDQLDPASREEIRKAIVDKGVSVPFTTDHTGWVRRANNWGQVCHGGMTIGALAVLEDEPELAAKTVHSALQNVVHAMAAFAPRGGYPEGPGYWSYGTSYNVALIDSLEHVFGTDFGLSAAPGFSETGAFPALACGPSGKFFNYADGGAARGPDAVRFWFAERYHRPDWVRGDRVLWTKVLSSGLSSPRKPASRTLGRFAPLALLWMSAPEKDATVRLPLSWSSGGTVPITVHRSSWDDPRATFVGLKAGSPSGNHGHMDIGSFVLDSDGVRWAEDLGAEDYYEIESRKMSLWNRDQNSDRWTIFRLSNLGHNTLVIDGQLQLAEGDAPVVQFSDDPVHPFSIVEMTSGYKEQVQSARRGIALLPSREVLIQDELTGLLPGSRVRWGMITPGTPESLGKKDVTLRQKEERLKLAILSPRTKGWTQIETEKPPHEWDSPNPGTRMMAFEAVAPASGKLTIAVAATPGSCTDPVSSSAPIVPLASWNEQR